MEKKITVGRVVISPLDVVSRSWLRSRGATRSDVDFGRRLGILRHRVWGAPDLVGEVVSPSSEQRDRTV